MGEMADDILDGLFCEVCGAVMENVREKWTESVPGYPRTCRACVDEDLCARAMVAKHFGREKANHRKKKTNKWKEER